MTAPALDMLTWDLSAELAALERECDAIRDELLRAQDAMTPRMRSRYIEAREHRKGPCP